MVVAVVAGEEMGAVVPGHEIEMFDGSGVQSGIDRVPAWIRNGTRRKAGVFVSVVGGIKLEITLMNDPIKFFDALDCVDHGGIALESHVALQAVVKNS